MKVIARNGVALLIGVLLGSAVNMGLVILGPSLIPPPPGVDVTDMDNLKVSMHLFEPRHFVFPFLAHALGTLVGAFVTAVIAVSHRHRMALAVGVIFLAGGITNVIMLPGPGWFAALDLLLAYLPMAWLGSRLSSRRTAARPAAG